MLANEINNNFKVLWRIEFTRLTFKCLHSTVKFSREWGFINHHVWIVKSHVISNWKSILTYLGLQASWSGKEPKSLVHIFWKPPWYTCRHYRQQCLCNFPNDNLSVQSKQFHSHESSVSEFRNSEIYYQLGTADYSTSIFQWCRTGLFSFTICTWAPPLADIEKKSPLAGLVNGGTGKNFKFEIILIKLSPMGLSLTHIVNPKISLLRLNFFMVVSRQDFTFSYLYTPFAFSYKLKIQAFWDFHKVI